MIEIISWNQIFRKNADLDVNLTVPDAQSKYFVSGRNECVYLQLVFYVLSS